MWHLNNSLKPNKMGKKKNRKCFTFCYINITKMTKWRLV